MNRKYVLYLLIFLIVIFRSSLKSILFNIEKIIGLNYDKVEIKYLLSENDRLKNEYDNLLDFKNNIVIENNYTVTNIYKNNYGFDKMFIYGDNYNIGDEVINSMGLIGIVSKIKKGYSEIDYLYNTNIVVKINTKIGKIIGKDNDDNLIISDIDNVNLNDLVYSVTGNYIGYVKKIDKDNLLVYVKTIDLSNLNYCVVISNI